MISVEDRLGFAQIVFNPRALFPGQANNPIEVTPYHGGLGAHRRHHFELAQFGQRLLFGFLRHTGLIDLGLEFFELADSIFALAHFLLNGFHLLIQIVLAL